MKLKPTMSIRPSEVPYLVRVSTPYRPGIGDDFKIYPGAKWEPENKTWLFPWELNKKLQDIAQKHNFEVVLHSAERYRIPDGVLTPEGINKDAKAYQVETISKASYFKSWMINYEMGLGKSLTAIEINRLLRTKKTLIVCPANVRLNWVDELKKWNPTCPPVYVLDTGEEFEEFLKDPPDYFTVITSYQLAVMWLCSKETTVSKETNRRKTILIPREKTAQFHTLILDESHYAKNGMADTSKYINVLSSQAPVKLALTATPICNEPKDLWHQLECLWPGRFGSFYQFKLAYCNNRPNEYASSGMEFYGLNAERASELEERLSYCSSRVTKKEVAHLLPPFRTEVKRIRAVKKVDYRELMVELKDPMRSHKNKLEGMFADLGTTKFDYAKELVQLAIEAGESHVCLFTYAIATAEKLGEVLRAEGHNTLVVTGKIPVGKRHGVLNEAKAQKTSILVASMKSVQEGIDLTPYTTSAIVELYWQPKVMIQVLGRLHRWTSKKKGRCEILVVEGTIEEKIAHVVSQKMKDMKQVLEHGMSDEQLDDALSNELSDDEFLAQLRAAAASRYEDDEYMDG